LQLIWWWLSFLADYFNCSWHHPIYNGWVLTATSVGVLLLLAPRGFPAKYLGLLYLVPLFFYAPSFPKGNNKLWFTLLDVGQGLAAVVQTKNHVLLYDTGPRFFDHDAGSSVIIPYLQTQGIKTLDTMVVSHGDSDHSGGAESILQARPVLELLTSVPENFATYPVKACFAGQHWQWDGVDFQMLSPPKNSLLSGNDASCVLKITTGENSILLPGDIERLAEDLLVKDHKAKLQSRVLIAPHHGSRTSSTSGLIDSVKPQYVIFPVGYKNRFRFPHKKVITRYMQEKALLFNASKTGAITFKFGDKSDILGIAFYRQKTKRFWHDDM
jgi:competence protein ComEC